VMPAGWVLMIVIHLDSGVFKVDGPDKKDLAMMKRCVRRTAESAPKPRFSQFWGVPVCGAYA
jgi:hypothetical protein